MAFMMQVVIGIGAKPAVGPFESIGLNSSVGGIQVLMMTVPTWMETDNFVSVIINELVKYKKSPAQAR